MKEMKMTQQIAYGAIQLLVLRQLDGEPMAEHLIGAAVIARAFDDAVTDVAPHAAKKNADRGVIWRDGDPIVTQRDALRFFFDGRMEAWAGRMGVSSESVRCFARGLADALPANPLSAAFAA